MSTEPLSAEEKQAFANEAEKALTHPLVTDVIQEFAENMGFEVVGLPRYGIYKVAHYVACVARAQALGIEPDSLRHTPDEANRTLLARALRLAQQEVPVTILIADDKEAT